MESRATYAPDGTTASYFGNKIYQAVSSEIFKFMALIFSEVLNSWNLSGAIL
jgi:hypothetical protein